MTAAPRRRHPCRRSRSRSERGWQPALATWSLLLLSAVSSLPRAAAVQCTVFTPGACWYTTARPDTAEEPLVRPRCAFRDCGFNHTEAFECPFHASGSFSFEERDSCPDFMQVEQRQQPDCDTACCGGVMPGRWTRPDPAGEPARRDYVPDAAQGCSYFPYRRAELLDKLLGEGIDIVVLGDSMMRQHFTRLVQMLRGRQRNIDYRVHTHGSYSYCDEADKFKTAAFTSEMKQPDKLYLKDCIPDFFAPHGALDAASPLAACSRRPARVDFIHAPFFRWQSAALDSYMETMDPTRKLVVITYVGVWVKARFVPSVLLKTLKAVWQRPAGGAVISLAVPTYREVRVPDRAARYRTRNQALRDWVAAHPGHAGFVDFEALSLSKGAPPTTANDKHYQCYTTWPRNDEYGYLGYRSQLEPLNTLRDPSYDNPVGTVWMTEDGECYDEMNRNLWVATFNIIMQAKEPLELPHAFGAMPAPIFERDPSVDDRIAAERIAANEAAAAAQAAAVAAAAAAAASDAADGGEVSALAEDRIGRKAEPLGMVAGASEEGESSEAVVESEETSVTVPDEAAEVAKSAADSVADGTAGDTATEEVPLQQYRAPAVLAQTSPSRSSAEEQAVSTVEASGTAMDAADTTSRASDQPSIAADEAPLVATSRAGTGNAITAVDGEMQMVDPAPSTVIRQAASTASTGVVSRTAVQTALAASSDSEVDTSADGTEGSSADSIGVVTSAMEQSAGDAARGVDVLLTPRQQPGSSAVGADSALVAGAEEQSSSQEATQEEAVTEEPYPDSDSGGAAASDSSSLADDQYSAIAAADSAAADSEGASNAEPGGDSDGVGGGVDEQPVDLPEVSIGAAGDADSEEGDSSTPSLGDRDGTE